MSFCCSTFAFLKKSRGLIILEVVHSVVFPTGEVDGAARSATVVQAISNCSSGACACK